MNLFQLNYVPSYEVSIHLFFEIEIKKSAKTFKNAKKSKADYFSEDSNGLNSLQIVSKVQQKLQSISHWVVWRVFMVVLFMARHCPRLCAVHALADGEGE